MRQEIVDHLTAKLKTITIANGYLTDIGKTVKEWEFIDETNPAAILQVRDVACSPLVQNAENHDDTMHSKRLTVNIICVSAETLAQPGLAPKTLRLVLKDILKAVNSIDWIPGVYNVELGDNGLGGQQESKKYMGLNQTIFIDYMTQPWQD